MKFTDRQLERKFCAMEKRRDAIRAASKDRRFAAGTRFALARASDELTAAMQLIQQEGNAQ